MTTYNMICDVCGKFNFVTNTCHFCHSPKKNNRPNNSNEDNGPDDSNSARKRVIDSLNEIDYKQIENYKNNSIEFGPIIESMSYYNLILAVLVRMELAASKITNVGSSKQYDKLKKFHHELSLLMNDIAMIDFKPNERNQYIDPDSYACIKIRIETIKATYEQRICALCKAFNLNFGLLITIDYVAQAPQKIQKLFKDACKFQLLTE